MMLQQVKCICKISRQRWSSRQEFASVLQIDGALSGTSNNLTMHQIGASKSMKLQQQKQGPRAYYNAHLVH